MFCQIATGSLPLSAIGVSPNNDDEYLACFAHTTPLRRDGQLCDLDATFAPRGRLLRRPKPCHRFLIEMPSMREQPGERTRPPAAAVRPRQRHRPLLRDLWRR